MYSRAWSFEMRLVRLMTLTLPATAPMVGSRKCFTPSRTVSGVSFESPSMQRTIVPRAARMPWFSARDLPPFGLRMTRTSAPPCLPESSMARG